MAATDNLGQQFGRRERLIGGTPLAGQLPPVPGEAGANLGMRFHSARVSREEHTGAVSAAQAADPSKNWSVSPPEEHTQSFAVQDEGGQTHGYYALKSAGRNTRYLGALVNTSGAAGVGKYALGRLQGRKTELDAFSGPLEPYYKSKGFETTSRMGFDDAYAPDSWNESFGRSDVIEMSRDAGGRNRGQQRAARRASNVQ